MGHRVHARTIRTHTNTPVGTFIGEAKHLEPEEEAATVCLRNDILGPARNQGGRQATQQQLICCQEQGARWQKERGLKARNEARNEALNGRRKEASKPGI
eukprot:scaffold125709_cov14-Tisochrysis_lutea.AAC.1